MRTLTLFCFLLIGSLSQAQAFEAKSIYSRYHEAIEVAKLCRDMEFTQVQIDAMASVIHANLDGDIGAERLSLLTKAQRDARDLIDSQGCSSDEAQELLALFDRDLAPVL